MNKKNLHQHLDSIQLTSREKEELLNKILTDVSQERMKQEEKSNESLMKRIKDYFSNQEIHRLVKPSYFVIGGIAVLSLLVLPELHNLFNAPPSQIEMESPINERQFFNLNGFRYAVIQEMNDADLHLEYSLGQLVSLEEGVVNDLGATFGVGGTVWKVEAYDLNFRVVIESEGVYYLGENVGKVDGSAFELPQYIETANFIQTTEEILVETEIDAQILSKLTGDEILEFLTELAESEFISVESLDFEEILTYQTPTDRLIIKLQLNDGTSFQMIMIPKLQLIFFGDSHFKMSKDLQQLLFEKIQ